MLSADLAVRLLHTVRFSVLYAYNVSINNRPACLMMMSSNTHLKTMRTMQQQLSSAFRHVQRQAQDQTAGIRLKGAKATLGWNEKYYGLLYFPKKKKYYSFFHKIQRIM